MHLKDNDLHDEGSRLRVRSYTQRVTHETLPDQPAPTMRRPFDEGWNFSSSGQLPRST